MNDPRKFGAILVAPPLEDLTFVRDLIKYQGPLLSLFEETVSKNQWLWYWCDCDESANRWAVIRTTPQLVESYELRSIDLLTLLEATPRHFVFLVDRFAHLPLAPMSTWWMIQYDHLPIDYRPKRGCYLQEDAGG